MNFQRIVVVGASAGGIKALTELVSTLPAAFPFPILVVVHVSRHAFVKSIADRLALNSKLKSVLAEDNMKITAGVIYLAPADVHLFVKDDHMLLLNGPHENRWRPSIDVLFRSAAASYGARVVGIILSGMLDDGTSGMDAIKKSGGVCIIQEPSEAEFSDMPENVLKNVEVDYRVPVSDMTYVLQDLETARPLEKNPPKEILLESKITERMNGTIEELSKLGKRSSYSCPDCGGGLWKISDEHLSRFRCHTGHVYTEKLLLEKQAEVLEDSLWVAIRLLEERRNLLLAMADEKGTDRESHATKDKLRKADDYNRHIEIIKSIIATASTPGAREIS